MSGGSMEHLNYCRQMKRQFQERLLIPSISHDESQSILQCMALAAASEKFLMPPGGLVIDDLEMRAIASDEALSLPHKTIAIEYAADVGASLQPGEIAMTKRIVFAVQLDDVIAVKLVGMMDCNAVWVQYPWVSINRAGAILGCQDGKVAFAFNQFQNEKYDSYDLGDYSEDLTVLLGLLNALACSNVHAESSSPKRAGKKVKTAFPFDSYHVLKIDVPGKAGEGTASGGHRSPREHLRRGHIRRLADGRRIWVNAAVIAAGRGAGVVTKDYAIRR